MFDAQSFFNDLKSYLLEYLTPDVQTEMIANQSLIHRNIVRYHGLAYQDQGKSVDLVFEYCERNLKDECREGIETGIIRDYTGQLIEVCLNEKRIS